MQLTFTEQVQTATIIVGVAKNVQRATVQAVEAFVPVSDFVKLGDIQTEAGTLTKIPVAHETVKRILFIGLGSGDVSTETIRNGFGAAAKALKESSVTIALDTFTNDTIDAQQAAYLAAEGLVLGGYRVPNYKTTSNAQDVTLEKVAFIGEEDEAVLESFTVGCIYAEAQNEARSLVNMPPNLLTATALADYAVDMANEFGLEVEVLTKAEITELGMGGILAVNQGSSEEPRVITLKYKATDDWSDVLGLVGKGVTYDTGGYSLKPKDGMVGMKGDMGGAAAVLGAMRVIAQLKPAKNVVAVIGSTDNMVSADAIKPDDVITMYNGKTVEVLNTDAEGRLVLADAVVYAQQQGANAIVDVATLTGGVIIALGMDKTGALTNDDELFETLLEASIDTDEFIWRLPLTENDKKRIRKSNVADYNNSPGRDGHMIFGGGFVGEFVGDMPWIHLDIAGTSEAKSASPIGQAGGTGVMVRTLAAFVEELAEN
ncbi:leucyl aminopeptidase [Caryophanon latum]|uniref:Probable cytosol aminopeptidase n=1 Tax=Caryophanon latum TaxID=33977 RepID=A0A1C0YZE1_9BACL|nr:leucyl aminopeptidase [Caryophanon latum]OCS92578.1 leucyl aminopeptidase [Caryophanon latum]